MSTTAKPRMRAEKRMDYCRICRSDRQQPGMSIGPLSLVPTGETVNVCSKCIFDMLKVLLKGPASSRTGRA
jgi:hypothetical protein